MTGLPDRQQFRALVVDDDPIVRRMVAFALQQEGFACDTASDGEQALEQLSAKSYDLLVTDLRMPNKHGHSLTVDVLARSPRPKIIVHTSIEDPSLTKDLIVRGVDDVIYKPANYAAFAAKAMGQVLRGKRQPDKPSLAESNGDDRAESAVPVDSAEITSNPPDDSNDLPALPLATDDCGVASPAMSDAQYTARG